MSIKIRERHEWNHWNSNLGSISADSNLSSCPFPNELQTFVLLF